VDRNGEDLGEIAMQPPNDDTDATAEADGRAARQLLTLLRARGLTSIEIEWLANPEMDRLTLDERIERLLSERLGR
jgi:hypothetical protein